MYIKGFCLVFVVCVNSTSCLLSGGTADAAVGFAKRFRVWHQTKGSKVLSFSAVASLLFTKMNVVCDFVSLMKVRSTTCLIVFVSVTGT